MPPFPPTTTYQEATPQTDRTLDPTLWTNNQSCQSPPRANTCFFPLMKQKSIIGYIRIPFLFFGLTQRAVSKSIIFGQRGTWKGGGEGGGRGKMIKTWLCVVNLAIHFCLPTAYWALEGVGTTPLFKTKKHPIVDAHLPRKTDMVAGEATADTEAT